MKKRHPSPFIAEMMGKFQQQAEQSPTTSLHPKVSQNTQKPPVPKRPGNLSHIKADPQKPPHTKEREQSKPTVHESPALHPNTAPPKPPRAKDRLQTTTQESSSLQPKATSQRGSHAKEQQQGKPTVHESVPLHIKAAPQRPPRAKDRLQNKPIIQESEHPYATPAPYPPSHMRDRVQNDAKIQDNHSLHIKAAPQRPPRAKDRLQNKPIVQESEHPYATPAPYPPSHMRDRVQNDAKIQKSETLHPSVRPKTPSHMKVKEQSSSSSQDSGTYAIPTSRKPYHLRDKQKSDPLVKKTASSHPTIEQPKSSHRQETFINKMERELLLTAYQEEIRFLCEKVYGNRLILNDRIEAIKENPDIGEQLLWDITEHPKSISKFSGRKVLGIKNGARKQAEETLPTLCATINDYVYTSKYTKNEGISQELHIEQGHQRQAQGEESIKQHLQNPLNSEKKIKPLSSQEITHRIQKDPSVQYGQREIQYWCEKVYKNPSLFNDRIEDIQKIPEMGEELVWQIENHSLFFAPLAGRQVLGIKNGARKQAEENLPMLCTAIKDYAETVKQLREAIVQNHQEQQIRQQSLTNLDKRLQKQQSLSHPPQLPERSTVKRIQEVSGTSRQEDRSEIRSRRTETSKTLAFS